MNKEQLNLMMESTAGSSIKSLSPLHGGSISTAYKAILHNGETFFLKVDPQFRDMFLKEAHGLEELSKTQSVKTPSIIFVDTTVLILEFLPATSITDRKRFFEGFGRTLAAMHRHSNSLFGFTEDNYIGSTPQKNSNRSVSWKEFYFSERLNYQFYLAETNGYTDEHLRNIYRVLERQLEDIIPDDGEPPALLHGDLWSGNYLCIESDVPAIIDPAVYYGHREADLGMTMLFGGFDGTFYSAYNEAYPLSPGWKQRMEIYKLYHLLNHLNLFGEGYYRQVLETIKLLIRW